MMIGNYWECRDDNVRYGIDGRPIIYEFELGQSNLSVHSAQGRNLTKSFSEPAKPTN